MDEDMEVDVAEAMGFASFGRKRKHPPAPLPARPAPGTLPAQQASQAAQPTAEGNTETETQPTATQTQSNPSLPARPPANASQQHRGAGRHQGRERDWWTNYYDPSSNENPWEILERKEGLEPVGSWLPRGHARGGAPQVSQVPESGNESVGPVATAAPGGE